MERSSRVLQHENPKIWIFSKKFEIEFCPYLEFPFAAKRNHLSFVNISPTLVIDASMERSSQEYYNMGTKKFDFFFQKVLNWIWLVFWLVLKSWNQHSSRSQHAPIYMSTSVMHRRPFECRHLVFWITTLCKNNIGVGVYACDKV